MKIECEKCGKLVEGTNAIIRKEKGDLGDDQLQIICHPCYSKKNIKKKEDHKEDDDDLFGNDEEDEDEEEFGSIFGVNI